MEGGFFRPTIKKVGLGLLLFLLTLLIGDGGIGFPLKFWAFGFIGLSAGFFKPIYLVVDVLFWYVLVCMLSYLWSFRRAK